MGYGHVVPGPSYRLLIGAPKTSQTLTTPFSHAARGHSVTAGAAAIFAIVPVLLAGPLALVASPEISKPAVDANVLAREVMRNEIQAQVRDQSLWSFRKIEEKDGHKDTFEVCQTNAGEIKRLIAVDGRPVDAEQRRAEDARIHSLLAHPGQMRREVKKDHEDAEQSRQLMKMFPDAFHFHYAGNEGELVKLEFTPNPSFHPSGHAAEVFYHMTGILVVDAKQKRLAEINGTLTSEVKFGGGIFGHLDKGGTFDVKQEDLGSGHWEVTDLVVHMVGKALFFKTIDVNQDDKYSNFKPVTRAITLAKAVQLVGANEDAHALQN